MSGWLGRTAVRLVSAVCVWWLLGPASALAASVLTPVAGSPFATGGGPISVGFSPTGALLATANQGANTVSVFAVNSAIGALTPVAGSPFATGSGPSSVAFSPTGGLLATANEDDSTVSVFAVDSSTGALTQVAGSPFPIGSIPTSVAFSPTGLLATANHPSGVNNLGGSVSVFAVDRSTGALTQVPGSPFMTGIGAISVAFSPTGGLLATANDLMATVSVFAVNASTGALTQVAGSPFGIGSGPRSVAFSSTGGLLATANGGGTVSVFAVDPSSGVLGQAAGSPFLTGSQLSPSSPGSQPWSVAFSPTGWLLAVANNFDNTVSVFTLAPPSASITAPIGAGVYAPGQSVTTAFSCTDTYGPGIASCTDSNAAVSGAGRLDTLTVGPHTYTVTATSKDGQAGTATINYTVAAPPTVTISAPASGARYPAGKVLDAGYRCQEGAYGPGIAACTAPIANGHRINTAMPGQHTFTVTVSSSDGQNATSTVSYTVLKPSNRIAISHVKTDADGTITLQANVPGPGKLGLLETASAGSHRFAYGHKHAGAIRAGVIDLRVGLNLHGARLVRRHRDPVVLRLSVTYTPTHGSKHTITFHGLHLPR